MSGLDEIAVQVESGPTAPTAQVQAILSEIETLLRLLQESGEPGGIDLRSLPLFPGDYEALVEALGEGEVSATVRALGPTEVRETAVPGVWWTIHRNEGDEVVAELIEVTKCPDILCTPPEDLDEALERLASLRGRGD